MAGVNARAAAASPTPSCLAIDLIGVCRLFGLQSGDEEEIDGPATFSCLLAWLHSVQSA